MSDEGRLVLVVGVGRSGTSLFAGILGQVGFHIPQPEIRADETNPRGFGEPRWVVSFHRRLMREARVTVFDARPAAWERTGAAAAAEGVDAELRGWLDAQLREAGAVVVKDPRISWFLDLWTRCAQDLAVPTAFVTMLRHPAEILSSARRSYGTWQADASRAAAWLNVMLATEHATRGAARAFVRYDDLLADWAQGVRRAGEQAGLPLLAGLDRTRFPAVDGFVDPSLHRSRPRWDDLDVPGSVRDMAEGVWEQLLRLAAGGEGADEARAALDEARAAFRTLYAEAEAIAQSSVTAARPPRRRTPAQKPGVQTAARRPPGPVARLRAGVARRVPARHRRRLRAALRGLRRSR